MDSHHGSETEDSISSKIESNPLQRTQKHGKQLTHPE
jgi:hypothetical protein